MKSLLRNLLIVYALYTLMRVTFLFANWGLYADHLSVAYALRLFVAGLRFDTTAILYTNCWLLLAQLLPLHWKEGLRGYDLTLRVLYTAVNALGLATCLYDCAYFPFTGRRTTCNVLQEFGGEGAGLVSILLHEGLAYWWTLPIGACCVWALWRGFRGGAMLPARPARRRLVAYYVSQTLLLALAAVLTIGGMRGGWTRAVRPITMSNANQYVTHSIDAGIVLNTPFSLIRTIGKRPFAERSYLPDDEAQRIYTPVHAADTAATFRPDNVVVFILESFGREGMERGFMPFLDSLAHVGRSFDHSFANGRKSIDGMPSVLSSIPSFVEPFFLTPASLNDLSGLAGELTRHKGYASAFFHGAENGSMGFEAFARATGFERYYGRTEYNADPRYGGDADFDGTWAIWDEEFLQYFCDHISDLPEPFVTSVFTASSHSPFRLPEKYAGRIAVTDPPLYGCIRYSDMALRRFFEKARRQPWFERTLFVLTADHTSEPTLPAYTSDLGRYRVPLIFYAPGRPELTGTDHERIVSQIDIMPTVLGLLGYDRPYIAFGQDALRTPPAATFAVNYLPGNDYFQIIADGWMLQFDGERVVHAYRYPDDPTLAHDLCGQHPADTERRLKSVIQQYMHRMNANQLMIK